jgi:hypothetical protein
LVLAGCGGNNAGDAITVGAPSPVSPTDRSTVTSRTVVFSAATHTTPPNQAVLAEYRIQFSAEELFAHPFNVKTCTESNAGVIDSGPIDLQAESLPAAIREGDFYWRIGARTGTGSFQFSDPFLIKRSQAVAIARP